MVSSMALNVGLFLIGILGLSCLSSAMFQERNNESIIRTDKKFRNLVIDLGNGLKTNAQLTYPAVGRGPFPGVLLIHGSTTVLTIRMEHWDLFTRVVLNHLRRFGK